MSFLNKPVGYLLLALLIAVSAGCSDEPEPNQQSLSDEEQLTEGLSDFFAGGDKLKKLTCTTMSVSAMMSANAVQGSLAIKDLDPKAQQAYQEMKSEIEDDFEPGSLSRLLYDKSTEQYPQLVSKAITENQAMTTINDLCMSFSDEVVRNDGPIE